MRKSLLCVAILVILLPAAIMAQTSNTSTQTMGLFGMDRDNYMNPTGWSGITSAILFLQFGTPFEGTGAFNAGVALPMKSIYLGANVSGYNYVRGMVPGGSTNESTRTETDRVWTIDALGNYTSETYTVMDELYYQNNISDSGSVLAGLKFGEMALGIYDNFSYWDQTYAGYLGQASWAIPGGATWNTIPGLDYQDSGAMAGIQKGVLTTSDGAGVVNRTRTTDVLEGRNGSGSINDTLMVGLTMPMGKMKLMAKAGAYVNFQDGDAFGAYEIRDVRPLLAYAAYTPPTDLHGATPAAINNLMSYDYSYTARGGDYTYIRPILGAWIQMPLTLGYASVLEAGISDMYWSFRTYSSDYQDLAGAAQTLSGIANWTRTVAFDAGALDALGRYDRTTTDTRAFETTTYTSNISQNYNLFGKLTVKPSDDFSFAVQLGPQLSFSDTAYSVAGQANQVVTYFDNDGVDTGDADDYVRTISVTRQATQYDSSSYTLRGVVNTGAQFYLQPGKLRVNLGGTVSNQILNSSTVTQLTDSVTTRSDSYVYGDSAPGTSYLANYQANLDPANQSTVVTTFGETTGDYNAGLTYFFSNAMYLDLGYNGAYVTSNIFELGSWTLQLTIKY